MTRMFLRTYANANADEARALTAAIEAALASYEPAAAASPRPYWKMPELFEFTYRLSSPTRDIWDDLVAKSSESWTVIEEGDGRSAVWNRVHDRLFLVPAVRWAELSMQQAA